MEKYLEKTGRTTDDAIAAALAELHLEREEVTVEVLQLPKSGFLGIGASPAVIRVSYQVEDEPVPAPAVEKPAGTEKPVKAEKPARTEKPVKAEKPAKAENPVKTEMPAPVADEEAEFAEVRAFLGGLLEHMGVDAQIDIRRRENGGIGVNLSGDSMGAIIGRRGETLDAIQHLTNYAVNKGNDKHMHISVDAEGYRSKREESLAHSAEKMAEKVLKYKRSMAFEPMNSYERHVIHTALQNYEGVTTSSTGVEPNRTAGFADSPERLNVALSRARRLLIVVGNKNFFSTIRDKQGNYLYRNAIREIESKGRVIEYSDLIHG